ncbi:MAG: cation diffusion facilitator family transporter [Saccharofermentanales bacterium]|jgi:cation diffusion facilitator family transporter
MIRNWLVKRFVKQPEAVESSETREQYGRLSSMVGIVLNLLLFAAKFVVGTLSGSIAITGDAFNNLSDSASSIITLLSFRLAGKPADRGHPFGHARIEYIASAAVSVLILVIGIELLRGSINKIIDPEPIEFSLITVIVLVLSIAAKLWLYTFYHGLEKITGSTVMRATALDSLSDVMATSAVLVSTFLSPVLGVQLDGYTGVIVAVLILITGYQLFKSMLDRLLGQGPNPELAGQIDEFIHGYEGVLDTHDLVVHDYGPYRTFASVHVEVDAAAETLVSHDLADNIERDIKREQGINLVVHLDPIIRDDPFVNHLRKLAETVLSEIDDELSLHDFRVRQGKAHSNLIFEVAVPYECELSLDELRARIQQGIAAEDETLRVVVEFDRA